MGWYLIYFEFHFSILILAKIKTNYIIVGQSGDDITNFNLDKQAITSFMY